MNVLITGGCGYLGGRLSNYLKEALSDYNIILTSTRDKLPSWTDQFEVEKLNLKDQDSITSCVEKVKPEIIIHLAAIPQSECQEDPDMAKLINVEATRYLVSAANTSDVQTFIYMSTFQVYGSNLTGIIDENASLNPASVYAQTKADAEQIVKSEFNNRKIIFRLSNAFGSPQDYKVADTVLGLAFNAFCRNCFADEKIIPRSNGYRDFVELSNVCRAIDHIMKLPKDDDCVYNLGGEHCLSICDVAEKVSTLFNETYQGNVTCDLSVKEREEDSGGFQYNIDRLKSTGYKPEDNFNKEILSTFKYFEDHLVKNG